MVRRSPTSPTRTGRASRSTESRSSGWRAWKTASTRTSPSDDTRALVGELEALITQYPVRERLRGQLIRALYRSGRQAEALEAYQGTRDMLVEELGVEPGRAPPAPSPNPEPGSRAGRPRAGATNARSDGPVPTPPTSFIGRERELRRWWDSSSATISAFSP